MRSARLGPAVLVAPAGALAGYGLGYLLAGKGHSGTHAVGGGGLLRRHAPMIAFTVGGLALLLGT